MAVVRLTVGSGETSLPLLDDRTRDALIGRFTGIVAWLVEANGDSRSWWYTWLSCRDRLNAPLLGWLEVAARTAATERDVTVGVPSLAVAREVSSRAQAAGHRVQIAPGDQVRLRLSDALAWARRAREVGRFVVAALRAMALSRRSRTPAPGSVDVVLVTIFEYRSITPDGWRDAYFGDLAAALAARGEQVAIVGHLRNTSAALVAAAGRAATPVVPLARFARMADVVSAARWGLAPGIRLPLADRALVRSSLGVDASSIATGWFLERSLSRLLCDHPRARVIHLFENNAWERAIDVAAASASPPRPTTGYLHCAVVPAHLKYRFDRCEEGLRPAPLRVVCTGPTARDVLLSLGELDPTSIDAGCALRGPDLDRLEPVPQPAALRRILVLLEGLWTMAPLVRMAAEAAAGGHVAVVLRAHPALAAERIAARAGVTIGGGLSVSTEPDLVTDIRSADAVAYKGTTTALTALALGVPAVHVDTGELLTDDPLFACSHLKRTARSGAELLDAARSLVTLDRHVFAGERDAARSFVNGYLAPVSEATLRPFTRGAVDV